MSNKQFTAWFTKQKQNYQGQTPPQLLNATDMTKYGHINMNAFEKGYFRRHGRQRDLARKGARWNMPNGEGKLPFPNKAKGACIYFGW